MRSDDSFEYKGRKMVMPEDFDYLISLINAAPEFGEREKKLLNFAEWQKFMSENINYNLTFSYHGIRTFLLMMSTFDLNDDTECDCKSCESIKKGMYEIKALTEGLRTENSLKEVFEEIRIKEGKKNAKKEVIKKAFIFLFGDKEGVNNA